MQQITVKTLDGGELVAERILPFDLIGFERRYKVSAGSLSGDEDGTGGFFEHLAFLAWHALKRQGDVTVDFDAFLLEVEEITSPDSDDEAAGEDEAEVPPTDPDQPTG